MKDDVKIGARVKLLGRASLFGEEAVVKAKRGKRFVIRVEDSDLEIIVWRMNFRLLDEVKIGGTD